MGLTEKILFYPSQVFEIWGIKFGVSVFMGALILITVVCCYLLNRYLTRKHEIDVINRNHETWCTPCHRFMEYVKSDSTRHLGRFRCKNCGFEKEIRKVEPDPRDLK
ncbi:MAG: hypothetical protein EKK54_08025 [Neisseriaceae bacterium]|nr:MAG: hypothetical protein EKK54_08025 [Neisseriaceae bacterium]